MSFVEPKSADTQAITMMMRTRDQLIGQRTATVNALRSHLAEFGMIAPVGLKNVDQLRKRIEGAENIPALLVEMVDMHFAQICNFSESIEVLTVKIKAHCTLSPSARLLQTMPGIGPIGAMSCIASAARHGKRCHPWLQDKLDRKPKMVAAIALANKMARAIWAMLTKGEAYKAPIAVSAQ